MATSLKPNKKPEEDFSYAHNPGEESFEDIINREFSPQEKQRLDNIANEGAADQSATSEQDSLKDQEQSSTERPKPSSNSISSQEQQPWENETSPDDDENKNKTMSMSGGKKAGIIASVVMVVVMGGASLIYGLLNVMMVSFKENYYEWSMKRGYTRSAQRAAKSMEKRYFREPQDCKGIRCRLKSGLSDREIRKLQRGGNTVEVGEKNGKKWAKSVTLPDGVKVDVNNYAEMFKAHPSVRQFTARTLDISGTFTRTTKMVIKLNQKLGVSRKNQLNDEKDKSKFKQLFRKYLIEDQRSKFSTKGKAVTNDKGEVTNGAQVAGDDGLNEDIQKAASEQREKLLNDPNAKPDLVPSIEQAGKVASGAATGSVRFSKLTGAAEAGCAGYKIIKAVDYGAKFYRMIGLIKYAAAFMTFADAMKTGQITPDQVAFFATMLLTPDAEGKNFFDSPMFQYMLYKVAPTKSSIGNVTNGTTFGGVVGDAREFINDVTGGNTDEVCAVVENIAFQIVSTAVSAVAAFFSGGTSLGLSMAAGAAGGTMLAVLQEWAMPILVQYAAGTVATGDEVGGEASTKAGAGILSLAGQLSRVGGLRPLKTVEAAANEAETNQLYNDFFPDKRPSLTEKITTNLAGFTLQGIMSSSILKPQNMLAYAGANYSRSSVYAVDQVAAGNMCEDEVIREMDWASTPTCHEIYSESTEKIDDPQLDPEKVMDYMINNEYVNEEDGKPRTDTDNGEEYGKYVKICMDGIVPMVNYNVDVDGEEVNPAEFCYGSDEIKYDHFRFFQGDPLAFEDPAEVDKLVSAGGGGGAVGGKLEKWPVGGSGGTISSCWNLSDNSYRIHHGMDIAAPIGTDLIAPADGVVTFAGEASGYGLHITIKHADAATGYGHNDSNSVNVGDVVKQGQVIGKVGNRGQSTGPHVHFSVMPIDGKFPGYDNASSYNPLKYLQKPEGVPDPNGCVAKAGAK